MNLCLTSDESWQYTFNIIERKILRQTSIIIDNSVNLLQDSQKIRTSLYKVNKNKYSLMKKEISKFIFWIISPCSEVVKNPFCLIFSSFHYIKDCL